MGQGRHCTALKRHCRDSERLGREPINSALANVRFGAHSGLKSDIAQGPKSASNGLEHRGKLHNYSSTLELAPVWRVDQPYGSMRTPGLSMPCGSSSLFAARSAAAK